MKIVIPKPGFDSNLTDLIIDLDYLRKKRLSGSTEPLIFFQLKHIFHTLESIGSARIEGNNTTIAEYIETKISEPETENESITEIKNVEESMGFIEKHIKEYPIDRAFISELHKLVVNGLSPTKEGDINPGAYRVTNVSINGANHKPPEHYLVNEHMEELIEFINYEHGSKYDLLKIAIVHHRFLWIHPFRNGNGRTVRLLTYAMLVKLGFNVDIGIGRIINPTAVFCADRFKYYEYLSKADSLHDDDVLAWCEYVLSGLKIEIEKIDKLLDYDFLKKHILLPALSYSIEHKLITENETKILKIAIEKQIFQAADLKEQISVKFATERSRILARLKEKKMLMPISENARKYAIRFDNNILLRAVIWSLSKADFLPKMDNNNHK